MLLFFVIVGWLTRLIYVGRRHHTNPVGTEWRWKMDAPEAILDGALTHHVGLIRQFKGRSFYFGKLQCDSIKLINDSLVSLGRCVWYNVIIEYTTVILY